MVQHHVLVHQHLHAQAPQLVYPRVGTRIIFMVAGHKIGAVARRQPGQWRHMAGQLFHAAVHQIAGNRHQIHPQRIHRRNDALQITVLDGWPHVNVADLRHGKAVQISRQPGNWHIHPHHTSRAPRVPVAQRRDAQAKQQHRNCAPDRQVFRRQHIQQSSWPHPLQHVGHQQQHIAQQRQHKQRRYQPHAQQPQPGQHVRRGRFGKPPPHQAHRHQNGRHRQQQP